MTSSDIVACSLNDADLKDRLNQLRSGLFASVASVREDSKGFWFLFDASADTVVDVLEFIRLERECCPFLHFDLALRPEPRPLELHLGADSDTGRSFVRETFLPLTTQDRTL